MNSLFVKIHFNYEETQLNYEEMLLNFEETHLDYGEIYCNNEETGFDFVKIHLNYVKKHCKNVKVWRLSDGIACIVFVLWAKKLQSRGYA